MGEIIKPSPPPSTCLCLGSLEGVVDGRGLDTETGRAEEEVCLEARGTSSPLFLYA